jgi:acyl carrier protein
MEKKVLDIINSIRDVNGFQPLSEVSAGDSLTDKIGLSSFDLAELTVIIEDEFGVDVFEDGVISTIGQIYEKLK